jgi:hypothetical protein
MMETESRFSESMVAGSVGGALGGAALGAIASGGSGRGAAIGAGLGALAGALGGYLYAKQQQAQTQQELLASIDADAARDSQQLAMTNSALGRLVACRQNEINQVAAQYRSKAITAAQAKAAYETIGAQMAEDGALINDVLGKSNDRAATYVSARTQTLGLEQVGSETTVASAPSTASVPPQNSVQAFQRATQTASAQAQEHQKVQRDLQARINELSAATG